MYEVSRASNTFARSAAAHGCFKLCLVLYKCKLLIKAKFFQLKLRSFGSSPKLIQ
jgi:hypothetical protein